MVIAEANKISIATNKNFDNLLCVFCSIYESGRAKD